MCSFHTCKFQKKYNNMNGMFAQIKFNCINNGKLSVKLFPDFSFSSASRSTQFFMSKRAKKKKKGRSKPIDNHALILTINGNLKTSSAAKPRYHSSVGKASWSAYCFLLFHLIAFEHYVMLIKIEK